MNKPVQARILASLLVIWLPGCMPDTNYQAYVDQKNKGPQIFLNDLEVCNHFVEQNLGKGEGSAGDRLSRKRSLFLLCMENHFWVLK